ncbi:hypothetical protein [Vulgatibacter incomptus]|uniref:VWFA domain-containing protein n=1 Tax=Vulgatibacter incomptus TaxID=1391653 RepID=A0A0K1PEK6_9BACT|nr:hypothetical protein [Vulgatibacter incomptus]AKU91846.1 hypothetical protein AKJ08_2233 [Vulgatibacter incomptus]
MNDAHLVETDAYDRDARARALDVLAIDVLVEQGSRLLPHFGELLEDLFAVCFKLVIRFRSDDRRSLEWNRRVLSFVESAAELAELRSACALDSVRSASAALAIGKAVLGEVRKGEILVDEELLAGKELEKSEERIGEIERSLAALREEGLPPGIEERFRRELEREREKKDELGSRFDGALDELPASFSGMVQEQTRAAAARAGEDDELVQELAEAVGSRIPEGAAERLALAERLRESEKLRRLAAIAGAFRFEALAARKRRIRRAPTETFRVGRGGELSRLLPSELVSLIGEGPRRLDFLRRLAERDLAEYELQGSDRGGRGPLVVCVDGSGSMRGPRELWSKGISLALLEIARRQNRRAEAIVFSGSDVPLARFELLRSKGPGRGGRREAELAQVMDFATHFPGGGTDFEGPLRAALCLLQDVRLSRGDIVFLTDGGAPLSSPFVRELQEEKRRLGFSIYGVLIDDPVSRPASGGELERGARELRKIADRLTTVTRLTSGALHDLFERL